MGNLRRASTALAALWLSLLLGLLGLLSRSAKADFVFTDFNETTSLIFLGDAGTTSCDNRYEYSYGDYQGKADQFNEDVVKERSETTDSVFESTVETNIASYNTETENTLAGFLHRSDTISAPTNCAVRVRLTPSGPRKTGAIWFRDPVPVSNGFDTYFTFQISDHSKECTLVKDQYFSKLHHRTCSVHGADGFAFVIHSGQNGTQSLGKDGGQMGFGGIENSLAIAFDTWTNPGQDTMLKDHVSIQSRGNQTNDGYQEGLLGLPRPHTLADGKVHLVRITYYGDLRSEYFDYLIASDSLLPYLKDNGEQKRIGTLLVFIDDGITKDIPLMALPINLSLLVKMPDDKAFIGFTSSTGRFYEKHDVLSWLWCDQEPCDEQAKRNFDYHQRSEFSTAQRQEYTPGLGYGGGDNTDGFPIKNQSPDTSPWDIELQYFAPGRDHGLAVDATSQVPPNTLY